MSTVAKHSNDQASHHRKRQRGNSKKQEHNNEEVLKAKNLKVLAKKTDGEKSLEDYIFGGEDEFVDRLLGATKARGGTIAALQETDDDDDDDDDDDNDKRATVSSAPAKKPVWLDDDDVVEESIDMTHRYRKGVAKSKVETKLSKEKLQVRLKEEFQKAMGGVPSWASRDSKKRRSKEDDEDSEEEGDDNLLSKTGNFLAKSSCLPKGVLEMKKCLNANYERPSTAPLTTVQFHPFAQVLMTAGLDRSVSLFQVDGKLNPKIQSIQLEKFPVFKARFSSDGEQVIATGLRHRYFYVYDMMGGSINEIQVGRIRGLEEKCIKEFEISPDGSFLLVNGSAGYLHLLSMKTKQLIGSMKMNSICSRAVFSPDGSKIFSNCDEGDVYVWDVTSRRCLNRFLDDGCLSGSSLAISKDSQYLSCGSNSGVVNIYGFDDCLQNPHPKPLKTVMNLVTTATSQVFNSQTEILAMASHTMDDAVKLVHIPSFTVFSNFPIQSKRKLIHLPRALDFSPHSGYFSIANNKGDALLYRLKHYSDF